MRLIGYGLLIVIFIIVCALSVLNAQPVSFNYLFGTFSAPLILLLLLIFVLGMLVGVVLVLLSRRKRRAKKASGA